MDNREEAIKYGTEWLKDEYLDARDGAFIEIALEALKQMSCDDSINREDALMCLTGEIKSTDTIETIIARFAKRIRKLPPAMQQPKTGHWIDDNENEIGAQYGIHLYKCSECDEYANAFVGGTEDWWDLEKPNYCPNCGARMVEPQESEDKE